MLHRIEIEPQYLVTDTGTSDGTQIKYYNEKKWYKIDRYGGEGLCESLVSKILELSEYDENNFVHYDPIIINGEPGCVSNDFLSEKERFISLSPLHMNIIGTDPAVPTSKMDYDDAIEYIIDFVRSSTGLDITGYLADTFVLDALILNEDRHFNNLGIIFDGKEYRSAPIFDNGKSLFIGNSRYNRSKSISENKKNAFAKAFSGSFNLNRDHLSNYASLSPDIGKIKQYLKTKDLSVDNVYSRLYKLCENEFFC